MSDLHLICLTPPFLSGWHHGNTRIDFLNVLRQWNVHNSLEVGGMVSVTSLTDLPQNGLPNAMQCVCEPPAAIMHRSMRGISYESYTA